MVCNLDLSWHPLTREFQSRLEMHVEGRFQVYPKLPFLVLQFSELKSFLLSNRNSLFDVAMDQVIRHGDHADLRIEAKRLPDGGQHDRILSPSFLVVLDKSEHQLGVLD